jgi:hypothetical protein
MIQPELEDADIQTDPDVELAKATLRKLCDDHINEQVRFQAAVELLHLAGVFPKQDDE